MSGIPENPEGIALILWIAALASAHDPGNKAKVAAVLDLFAECQRAVEGERPSTQDRRLQ